MYTIVSGGAVPRASLDTGALVGYGFDKVVLHQTDGNVDVAWWSAMSMAAVLTALEHLHKSDARLYMSRFYNWRRGSWHDAYTQATSFTLKADAPNDAVELLSQNIFVPLFEKLLADGTLIEYRVDVEAEHTEASNTFWISFITPNAEGLDKVNAAIADTFNANPLVGPTFGSAVDFPAHRDYLYRTDATYR